MHKKLLLIVSVVVSGQLYSNPSNENSISANEFSSQSYQSMRNNSIEKATYAIGAGLFLPPASIMPLYGTIKHTQKGNLKIAYTALKEKNYAQFLRNSLKASGRGILFLGSVANIVIGTSIGALELIEAKNNLNSAIIYHQDMKKKLAEKK